MADQGPGLVGSSPEVSGDGGGVVEGVAGQDGGGEQAADCGEALADEDFRDQRIGGVDRGRWSFPSPALVTARNAWASMQMLTCRCQGVQLRTWYWSKPSRSLPALLSSSMFHRSPAAPIIAGMRVPIRAWTRKYSTS